MATKGRLYNGLAAAKDSAPRTATTAVPAKKEDASWIGAKTSAQDKPKPWNQRANNNNNPAPDKPSWAASNRKLLEPSPMGVSHARSETDLTGINKPKTTPAKDQEIFTSSEQLNVEDDDDDVSVSVTLNLPKRSVATPKASPSSTTAAAGKSDAETAHYETSTVKFETEPDELKNWSLSDNERADLRSRLSNVLGRRSASKSPVPKPGGGGEAPPIFPPISMPPIPGAAKSKATPASQPTQKRTSEKADDDFGAEHAVRPSAVKATQPKLQDVVGAGSPLAQKAPKNINKEALLDQFNAMWDKADEIPEIEIIKCGLPETKSIPEPENDTDVEYCIQRLLANDPELTEINLNNMKRTALPQLHRLLEALYNNNYLKKLSLANLGLSDTGLEPLLAALEANQSLKVLNLETNYLSGDFIARIFQALLKNQTLEEVKAVNQSVIMGSKAEGAIMKAIHQNRGLWKVSLSLRVPEAKQKIDQALIRNGELRRLKRQIEAMGAQGR